MSISDRLGEVMTATEACMEDRPADPNAVELATLVPAMVSALRAVLDRHQKGTARVVIGTAGRDIEHCIGCTQGEELAPWPCATYRAIEDALGEEDRHVDQ